MKRMLPVFSFLLLIFAACTPAAPTGQIPEALPPAPSDEAAVNSTSSSEEALQFGEGAQTSSASAVSEEAGTMQEQSSSRTSSSEAASVPAETQTRVINMIADNWSFTPSAFAVRKGERVELHVTGNTGIHGFSIPALDINVSVSAGETKVVTIPTNEAGTFSFRCSIPCGSGHANMVGTVTIEE